MALDAGEPASGRWARLAIVFQGAMNALNPVRRSATRWPRRFGSMSRQSAGAARRARGRAAGAGGHPGLARDYPHTYSGGMRQRAMIALALACNPEVIVADEPTTALDVMIQAQILELLDRLRRATGDGDHHGHPRPGRGGRGCDRVLVMYGGLIAEEAEAARLYAQPRHPYTQRLLASFPDLAHPERELVGIAGTPPRLDAMPPGCPFAPRCPHGLRPLPGGAARPPTS